MIHEQFAWTCSDFLEFTVHSSSFLNSDFFMSILDKKIQQKLQNFLRARTKQQWGRSNLKLLNPSTFGWPSCNVLTFLWNFLLGLLLTYECDFHGQNSKRQELLGLNSCRQFLDRKHCSFAWIKSFVVYLQRLRFPPDFRFFLHFSASTYIKRVCMLLH